MPHPAVLAAHVANLPPHLRPGAQIALDSGLPHIAAQITEGAMRGDSATTIASSISTPSIGDSLAQVFGSN